MSVIRLSVALRGELETCIRRGYPHETCGLLLGRRSAEFGEVSVVRQARNLNRSRAHDRYELDPEDFLAADRLARSQGIEIIGIWHSHPDHPAHPSETDREAAWQGWSYVIAKVTTAGVEEITSWRLNDQRQFEEERLES